MPWQPIGTSEKSFAGTFDGNGHTISGLYFNDDTKGKVGVFGMTNTGAYIHDLGVKDSYFYGKNHVGGICGDFAWGRIENYWNGATISAFEFAAGGISGSCWINASIAGCYNIGVVNPTPDVAQSFGGICGSVYKNEDVAYTISNCVSLEGKCDVAYNRYDQDANISNVFIKNATTFASGEVCWIVNGLQRSATWRQRLGTDIYPVLTGRYLVYNDANGYHNETVCEVAANHLHSYETPQTVTRCDGSEITFWHCTDCGKNYQHNDKTIELSEEECSAHLLEFVKAAMLPTSSTTGHYDYWHCTRCGGDFLEGNYSTPATSEQLTVPVHSNNNEIWYISTNDETIPPYKTDVFGAAINGNRYEYGLGTITFDGNVTGIGNSAFDADPENIMHYNACANLQSMSIPSSVTNIGKYAFEDCLSLQEINIPSGVTSIETSAFSQCVNMRSITFKSLPAVSNTAFSHCPLLSTKILDLTDNDKPHIGTSLENYPGFTAAHYHGTLEPNQWGTIVLPFVPSSYSGIVFFAIDNVDAANGTLTLSIAENIEAGKPYLFRNQTDDAGFTLSASASNIPVNITASEQTVGNFALKGTFQAKNLTETGLYEQQGGAFVHTNSLSIDPFRAYLKNNGGSALETIVINCDDVFVEIINEDDSVVSLYGLKKVEFIEQDNTPAVRVTYADDSTVTYLNPKKVEFGK